MIIKKTPAMALPKRSIIFLFVINYYLLPITYLNGQSDKLIKIKADIVGIDGNKLTWNLDYDIQLYANGKVLGFDSFSVDEYSEQSLNVAIQGQRDFTVLLVKLIFKDYHPYLKNIRLNSKQEVYELGKIIPEPNELMIAHIDYEEISEEGNSYMDFAITFRNNSREKILAKKLTINTDVEISCLSPNPIFATVTINNKIGYLSPTNEAEFSGTFINSDKINEDLLIGKIIYNDCGEQSINLDIKLSFIIPEDKFSRMLIRVPNELEFYNHERSETAKPTKLNIAKNTDHPDPLNSIYQIFSKIPEIKFEFDIESNRQDKVYSMINDFF